MQGAIVMETKRLAGLEPASVFGYFEEICAIPHGSRNTKMISDYLVNFAKEHDLRYIQDEADNVILFGDATPGYEDHPAVILQGHMDMVCEKDADCPIDMTAEGLDVTHDGNVVFANGTTLGADNGIAVAMGMAILADKTIPHPPVEVLVTSDEEIGLLGSSQFKKKYAQQMESKLLINFDCVSDGDHILIAENKAAKEEYGELLESTFVSTETKEISFCRSEKVFYPSDHIGFPNAVAVAAFHKKKFIGHYIGRIHTGRDTVFDECNIELLTTYCTQYLEKANENIPVK